MRRYTHRDDRSIALHLVPAWLKWADQQNTAGAYIATWIAFNAIYVAEFEGPFATLKEEDGQKEFTNRYEYGFRMAKVKRVSERRMIQHILLGLPDPFKRQLVALPSPRHDTRETCLGFFARRVPIWQAERIEEDALGQPVRGVINVRETISRDYPRWVPVDLDELASFLAKCESEVAVPDKLIEQMGDILYTVRNNLFHGCKGPDDSNDEEVLRHALELLRAVVGFYADER